MPAAWSLPVTFFCLHHGQLLASRCPHCGRRPVSRTLPSQAGHCGGPRGCSGRLGAVGPPRHDGTAAARQAQQAISGFLAGTRDPAGTADNRRHAPGQLTGITLTACHLAADGSPQRRPGQEFTPGMLDADVLTAAFTLLTANPVASLVTVIPPGAVPPAIPSSWRPASPALPPGSPEPATRGCGPLTGSGTRPRCPSPAPGPGARPVPLTWPPPARPGCPASSGRAGRPASPATPPPPAMTSSCPPR
jgi:hypothetical protein